MPAITITDLENAKTDVDHLAAIANSTELTATDRLGRQKRTLAGLSEEFPNAAANAAAAAAAATQAANEAQSAATAVGLAFNAATAAQASRVAAEAARDAAELNAGIYDTTVAGLAATTTGQYFSVPGSTSTVLKLYKNNAGVAQLINSYPASNVAKLGRVTFSDNLTTYLFSDTAGTDVLIGWTTLRFLKGDGSYRAVADRAQSTLIAGNALYIDVATDTPTYTAQEAEISTIAVDVVMGTKILLAYNYYDGCMMGELVPMLMNAKQAAATASAQTTASTAQTTANTAQTNALAARRMIVGEITSIAYGGATATVSISQGTAYKENNSGAPEKTIAPLTAVTLTPHQGIVVDLVGGSIDGSGRVVPTVVTVASGAQVGWQSGNKYLLAVNDGISVRGLYQLSQENSKLARRLVAGRVTKADWSGASVTVDISEGRAYKEANAGLPEKIIAPLTGQTLGLDECLIVDLTSGSVDASGRYIPVKLLVGQGAASGWQTANKYVLVANSGFGVLSGEYKQFIPAVATASAYSQDEAVVIQRADEVDIYMKGSNPASARYLRYRMQRKPSPSINSDVWRWNEVWEVERTGDYSFTTLQQLCNAGENEMAIRQLDKSDFMGGTAHGDEELFTVTMLIDGVATPLGGTGNYRARRVEFLQGSDMYEVDTVPAKLTRLARSYKRWVFEAGEVEVFNNVAWEAAVTLNLTFMSMLTFMRWNVDTQISNRGYRSPLYLEEDVSDTYKINLTGGGSGFVNGETVTITANDGSGAGMEGTATVAAGAITAIKITKNGTNYTLNDAVTIASKTGAGNGATGAVGVGFPMVYTTAGIAKASGPTGYSAEVEILEGWDKPNRRFNFSNAPGYNKFYFDFTGPNYVTQVGEVFKSRTRYKLDTKN